MRVRTALWLSCLGLLNAGCAVLSDSVHVVDSRARQAISNSFERHRNQQWAAAAWAEVRKADPAIPASDDFASGFRDGFAEHVYRGTTEPPPLLPHRYRTVHYQSPAGHREAAEWLAGYRRGIVEAHTRGFRALVIGPSSHEGGTVVDSAAIPLADPSANLAPAVGRKPSAAETPAVSVRAVGPSRHAPPTRLPLPSVLPLGQADESRPKATPPPPATAARGGSVPRIVRSPIAEFVRAHRPTAEAPVPCSADRPRLAEVPAKTAGPARRDGGVIPVRATVATPAAGESVRWQAAPAAADGPVRWRPALPGPGSTGTVQDGD